jgi:flagellar protein FlgJ
MVAVIPRPGQDATLDAPTRAAEGAAARVRSGPGGPDEAAKAARQFESVLLQQMIQVLRKTAQAGGPERTGASQQYFAMFDQAIAEQLSEGGGIGLARVIGPSLGADPAQLGGVPLVTPGRGAGLSPVETDDPLAGRLAAMRSVGAATAPPPGAAGALARAAAGMSAGESARHWARDGVLTHADLASPFQTPTADGRTAAFNVEDANGFEGFYKCNLFALEAARRAGYAVPVQARAHGWGYPNPDGVIRDASDGRMQQDWSRIVTQEGGAPLVAAGERGQRAFVLAGSGSAGHAGHMAVVERIHDVDYDAEGHVERIVFDGWEARARGAQRIEGRVWTRVGHAEKGARNGLSQIEVLELRRPTAGEGPETPTSRHARASLKDHR